VSNWKCKACNAEAVTLGGPKLMCSKKDCKISVTIAEAENLLNDYAARIKAGHPHDDASANMKYVPITWE